MLCKAVVAIVLLNYVWAFGIKYILYLCALPYTTACLQVLISLQLMQYCKIKM